VHNAAEHCMASIVQQASNTAHTQTHITKAQSSSMEKQSKPWSSMYASFDAVGAADQELGISRLMAREQPTRSSGCFAGSHGSSRRGVIVFSLEAAGAADEELWCFHLKPMEQPTRSYGVFAGSRGSSRRGVMECSLEAAGPADEE